MEDVQQPAPQSTASNVQAAPGDRVMPAVFELPSADSFFPQSEYRPNAPLCFLHITKTAGTSVRLTIENAFDGERTFPSGSALYHGDYVDVTQAEAAGDDFSRFKFASGHQGAKILERLPAETNSFVWFRDPRDRLLSSFFFSVVQRSTRPLSELQRRAASERLEAVFTDWLGGIADGFSFHAGQIMGVTQRTFPEWQRCNPGVSLQERALEVVRRSFFVGMVEDYDRAMDYFCAVTGILPPRQAIRRNVGKRRHLGLSLDESVQRQLQHRLAPDIAFCGLLREIYTRQMQLLKEQADSHPLLRLVGQRDALRAALMEQHEGSSKWQLGTWNAWDAALVENLDGRERQPDDPTVRWRWTGPSDETLFYFSLRGKSDLQLDLDLYSATPWANAAAARLSVESEDIPLTVSRAPGLTLTGIIPAALIPLRPRLLEFRLVTPVMTDEADLSSIASRKLGLALQRISVTPRPRRFLSALIGRPRSRSPE